VHVTRSSTPFRVFLRRSNIVLVPLAASVKTVLFLSLNVPFSQPIGTTSRRDWDALTLRISRVGNSPNSKKFKFLTNFRKFISHKQAKIFSPNLQCLYGSRVTTRGNLKIGVGPQIWAWGGAKFSIGLQVAPPSSGIMPHRPAPLSPSTRQWAPLQHVPTPGPLRYP